MPARRGFTLIELLTVIAIIGILAAILIPTVGAVRRKAATAVSASNLKQIGSAMLLFANDNKSQLPAYRTAENKTWDTFLLPYLFHRNDETFPDDAEKIMMHPRDERGGTAGRRRGYAINNTTFTNSLFPLSKIKTPNYLIIITERPHGSGEVGGWTFSDVSVNGTGPQVRDVPANWTLNSGLNFNYLFVDGSVRYLAFQDTFTSATSYGGNAELGNLTGRGKRDLWRNL